MADGRAGEKTDGQGGASGWNKWGYERPPSAVPPSKIEGNDENGRNSWEAVGVQGRGQKKREQRSSAFDLQIVW